MLIRRLMRSGFAITVALAHVVGCGVSTKTGKWSPSDFFTDSAVVALTRAAASGDVVEIRRLIDSGVDVNSVGKDGMTPLLYSLWSNNKAGFEELLKLGADPCVETEDGKCVIHFAAIAKDTSEWLRLVVEYKGNVNVVNPKGFVAGMTLRTPLFDAIDSGRLESVKILLAAGANPNHKLANGMNPAEYAAHSNFWQEAELCIEAGADYSRIAPICFDMKPDEKFEAAAKARRNVMSFLRQKGVDVDAAQKSGSVQEE